MERSSKDDSLMHPGTCKIEYKCKKFSSSIQRILWFYAFWMFVV